MGQRVSVRGKLKPVGVGAAKASSEQGVQSRAEDPKPSDLAMARLKVG